MAYIPGRDAAELRAQLALQLEGPVTLDFFTKPAASVWAPGQRECETCAETQQLLEEAAKLSDKITLRVHDVTVDREAAAAAGIGAGDVPAVVLTGAARGRVRLLGIPAGLEFWTLLRSVIDVARGRTNLAPTTRTALDGLAKDVHIRVFVTPSCPFCPRAAQIAHQMAVESRRVTADVIEAQEFPELARRYNVHGVPKIVVNDTVEFVGAQPEERFLEHVVNAAS
jgi:glutaredoxin-like protein